MQPRRPWIRLHWLTIFVVAWLGWAIANCQFARHDETALINPTGFESHSTFGWPLRHVEDDAIYLWAAVPLSSGELHWNPLALFINVQIWFSLLLSTTVVIERWQRAPNRLQYGMHALLAVTGLTAALVALMTQPTPQWVLQFGIEPSYGLMWCNIRRPFRLVLPLGVACAIYFAAWLAYRIGLTAYSWLRLRRGGPSSR